eukprot:4328315-Prymnesium_polylepis.2
MTDILQVMDLIVNGPLKSGIRRARIETLFGYFQSFKIARLQHLSREDGTPPPDVKPPKPTQHEGLRTVFKVIKETLETEKFEKSMKHNAFTTWDFQRGLTASIWSTPRHARARSCSL